MLHAEKGYIRESARKHSRKPLGATMKNIPKYLSIVFTIFYMVALGTFAQPENKQDSLLPITCPTDSLISTKIKYGFYYRIVEHKDSMDELYNQIEWIHIDKNNRIRTFLTANFEYCMLDMDFAKKPKDIKKQIKRNKEKFEHLYLKCNEDKRYVASIIIGNRININIDEYPGDIIAHDVLIFTKNGLIRTFRSYIDCESLEYRYIGN